MSCEACRDNLVLLLHDELDAAEAREVAAHVRGCDACAVEYCRVHLDLVAVIEAHELEPPAHVHAALRAKIAEQFAPRPWTRVLATLRKPVPAYGLALAAMVPLVLWLGAPSAPPAPVTTTPVASPERTPSVRIDRPELSDFDGAAATAIDPTWM